MMHDLKTTEAVQLEGKSPFELRVELSKGVSEQVVKKALETGDLGFLHSFTTGSAVDGPGMRLVAWTAGCQFRCLYCHNPDTWNMMNGMAIPLDRVGPPFRSSCSTYQGCDSRGSETGSPQSMPPA